MPQGLIICRPSMETKRASLDFNRNTTSLGLENGVINIPPVTEALMEDDYLDDEFTPEDEGETRLEFEDTDGDSLEKEEELVLALKKNLKLGNDGDLKTQLNEAHVRLPADQQQKVCWALLLQKPIVT